jgi:hypothetical protein
MVYIILSASEILPFFGFERCGVKEINNKNIPVKRNKMEYFE